VKRAKQSRAPKSPDARPASGPLKLKKAPLSPVQVTEFARAALERQLDPEMLERQAVLLGKQARRELTPKEREELETIGRLAKTLQDERAEAWEVLNKASQ
jgi:hypothetical protein